MLLWLHMKETHTACTTKWRRSRRKNRCSTYHAHTQQHIFALKPKTKRKINTFCQQNKIHFLFWHSHSDCFWMHVCMYLYWQMDWRVYSLLLPNWLTLSRTHRSESYEYSAWAFYECISNDCYVYVCISVLFIIREIFAGSVCGGSNWQWANERTIYQYRVELKIKETPLKKLDSINWLNVKI